MHYEYPTEGLNDLIASLRQQGTTGALSVTSRIGPHAQTRSHIFVWHEGEITYGDTQLPDGIGLGKRIGQVYKPVWIDSALEFIRQKNINSASCREVMETLVRLRVCDWPQIENFVQTQTAWALEQSLPYAGQAQLETTDFDLSYDTDCHGLNWTQLQQQIDLRRQDWANLLPEIPSMEAAPYLVIEDLQAITELTVRQHLKTFVDGTQTLVDIAHQVRQDPLQLAQIYQKWVQIGRISFSKAIEVTKGLPTVLAVDDSPIIQVMVKRALSTHYEVLTAGTAMDALQILNQQGDRISLLILDVTMPDIDGLELCRTIRGIPKIREIPIIMLTARDGFVDRMKGQIAGTNHYLNKPFDADKLLALVKQYV